MAGYAHVRTISCVTRDGNLIIATDASSSGDTSEDRANAAIMGGLIGEGHARAGADYHLGKEEIGARQLSSSERRNIEYATRRRLEG